MLNLKFLTLWLHSVSPSTLHFSHTRCISGGTPMGAMCLVPLCLYSSWTFNLKCPCPLSIRQTLKMLPSFSSNVTWSTRHHSPPPPGKSVAVSAKSSCDPMLIFHLLHCPQYRTIVSFLLCHPKLTVTAGVMSYIPVQTPLWGDTQNRCLIQVC